MSKGNDLTGKRFGNLTVLKKEDGLQNRYYTWRCLCDCGNEIVVNTKNLTAYRTTHCGCKSREHRITHRKPKDRTGIKYAALTAVKMIGQSESGDFLWECECECGNHVNVQAKQLQRHHIKDCGCGIGVKPKYKNIAGNRKGKLTALYPTDKRDRKGSVVWKCACDCGNEIEMTESDFMFGNWVSCGCIRQQNWDNSTLTDRLTFVDGTCVEWIAKRKSRSDNSSGFRGVYKYGDIDYRVYIGLQGKKYYLGRYDTFEEAVSIRLAVEKQLHEGFVSCYALWKEKSVADNKWGASNPFFYTVEKIRGLF